MFAVALTALPALASGNARAASGEPWRLAQSAVNERQDRFRREQAPRDMDEQVRRTREQRERDDRRELERRALQRQLERRELERREQERRDQDRRR
jgi:cell division protein FtsN